jgi:hypothetical protein
MAYNHPLTRVLILTSHSALVAKMDHSKQTCLADPDNGDWRMASRRGSVGVPAVPSHYYLTVLTDMLLHLLLHLTEYIHLQALKN